MEAEKIVKPDEAQKIAIECVKEDLKRFLREIDGMTFDQVRDRLVEILWGMGYNEGYFIGHYEGKTGRSFVLKDE